MSNAVQMRRVRVTPTLDTSAYATGDQVSALQTVNELLSADGMGSRLSLITILDKAKQKSALDLFFFDRVVTVAADNAAADMTDADMINCMGVVNILATDYDDTASNSFATVNINFPMKHEGSGQVALGTPIIPRHRVYMAIVARGAPTYAASDLVITLTSETDE